MTQSDDTFSVLALATMVVILACSGVMFWLNARRWTTRRRVVELSEWADVNRFKLRTEEAAPLPLPLANVLGGWRVNWWLSDDRGVGLLELRPEPHVAAQGRWHLLVFPVAEDWHPTGLRPAQAQRSLLDRMALPGHPALGAGQRFILYGSDPVMASRLARSQVRALVPADLGLVLIGRQLVLDFSDRPFDGMELGRVTALAEQIAGRLPAVG